MMQNLINMKNKLIYWKETCTFLEMEKSDRFHDPKTTPLGHDPLDGELLSSGDAKIWCWPNLRSRRSRSSAGWACAVWFSSRAGASCRAAASLGRKDRTCPINPWPAAPFPVAIEDILTHKHTKTHTRTLVLSFFSRFFLLVFPFTEPSIW